MTDQEKTAGYHTVRWDGKDAQGKDLVSGIYLCRIATDGFHSSRKLALVR